MKLHQFLIEQVYSVHCAGLLDIQNILSADTGISRQTESHSFGDHLISESVSVTPSSVIEASIVLCSVSLWLVWVNVQTACALNTRYLHIIRFNCIFIPVLENTLMSGGRYLFRS
jgi:hypothetical protein